MKIAFLLFVVLHALLHLLGFVKAFGLTEVKELSQHISRPMGLLWLSASLLFLTYAYLQIVHSRYAWLLGLVAVLLSQLLILLFWQDAKMGSLPNLIILLVALGSFGQYQFQKQVQRETGRILNQNELPQEKKITEADIKDLPPPVQKWLRSSGAVGSPYINLGKVEQKAALKMKPGQEDWLSATALQYTNINEPGFIWTVAVKRNALLHFRGRDKFENGKGQMTIKLNSLVKLVDEEGPKLDEGSLQRYLGEMVWFPSLALSEHINWEPVNDTTATAHMSYKGTTGSGTFYFNEAGDFVKFSALRYRGNEADSKKQEWVLLVKDYKRFEGIKVPSKMTATWKLEEGDWTWLELELVALKYNGKALE